MRSLIHSLYLHVAAYSFRIATMRIFGERYENGICCKSVSVNGKKRKETWIAVDYPINHTYVLLLFLVWNTDVILTFTAHASFSHSTSLVPSSLIQIRSIFLWSYLSLNILISSHLLYLHHINQSNLHFFTVGA